MTCFHSYLVAVWPMSCLIRHELLDDRAKGGIVDELNIGGGDFARVEAMIHAGEENTNNGVVRDLAKWKVGNLVHRHVYGLVL